MTGITPESVPEWIEYLEHTADSAIQVRAQSPAQLYARAAWGLFSLITDLTLVRPGEHLKISVSAENRETLMVRWLSELNVLHETEQWLFCAFDVDAWSETRLHATVHGEPFDSERHRVYSEVKAVTYHLLEVVQAEAEWRARILFDV